jgi:hypothetical protein
VSLTCAPALRLAVNQTRAALLRGGRLDYYAADGAEPPLASQRIEAAQADAAGVALSLAATQVTRSGVAQGCRLYSAEGQYLAEGDVATSGSGALLELDSTDLYRGGELRVETARLDDAP